jgi:flagellar hook-associated protein 3 FlgL
MRISTQQVFLNNIDNLSKTSSELFKTQNQLSTGKKILQPSDDPIASAQVQKFKKEIARTEQFSKNIEVSERRLVLEENTIDQINNLSIRLKELTIQGKNGVLNSSDRISVAAEVGEIVKALDGLMNTKDVQGEYLFSGHQGFTKPYEMNAGTGRYEFKGDDGQRYIQVGPENKVASTDSGFDIFEKVAKVSGYILPEITQTGGQISEVAITDSNADAFDEFMTQNAPLTFSFSGGALTVTNNSGQVVTADSPSVALNSYNLASNPNSPVLNIAGVDITFASTTDGTATLDVNSQHNIINTAVDLRDALNNADVTTAAGKEEFNKKMDQILANLSGIEDKNIETRASIGGRLNALEQQDSVNEDYKLFTKEALSSFEDLDFNEAISRFELQQTVLQASYASFAKIQDLSLFNYIN